MRKINVLYLDHSNDYSGGQISLVSLLSLLDREKVNPLVAVDEKAIQLKEELDKISVQYVELPFNKLSLRGLASFIRIAFQLRAIVRKHSVDIIHANTFMVGLIAAILKPWLRRPTIFRARLAIDYHGHGVVDRIITLGADLVLANSNYVKRTFEERFGQSQKIVAVYNPLKLDDPVFDSRPVEGKFVFVIVGRIELIKRHLDVVEAVETLARSRKDFCVKIVGAPSKLDNGKYYEQVKGAISTKGLEEYFIWTGFVRDPMRQISPVHACISCTMGEALSRTVFECQYVGIPVIASASGGNEELIRDGVTGFLFTPGDSKQLAEKMQYLMANYDSDKVKELRVQAREQTVTLFSDENTVRREESLYRDLVSRISK
jgi:Glycosyltransferase